MAEIKNVITTEFANRDEVKHEIKEMLDEGIEVLGYFVINDAGDEGLYYWLKTKRYEKRAASGMAPGYYIMTAEEGEV